MSTDQPWHIYRDGGLYTVPPSLTSDPFEAIYLADPLELGKAHGGVTNRTEFKSTTSSVEAGQLPLPAIAAPIIRGPDMLKLRSNSGHVTVLAAWIIGPRKLIVQPVTLTLHECLGHAVRFAELSKAAASLARQRVGVSLFKSGKRKGQPKFTREHDDAFRAEVRKASAANEALEKTKAFATERLERTLDILQGAQYSAPLVKRSASKDLDEVAQREELLTLARAALPWTAKTWLDDESTALATERAQLESVRDHGFPVGSRCVAAPPEHDHGDPQPEGVCTVLSVHVSTLERTMWRGPGELAHERTIQADNGEWTLHTDQLRPA